MSGSTRQHLAGWGGPCSFVADPTRTTLQAMEPPLNLEILVRPLEGSRLVEDYLRLEPALASFYPGSPWDPDAYRRKADEIARRFNRDTRARAARSIRATSPHARERLARLVEAGGAFVTTGQQPGLFTGPLYTVYKALTAIRLADALERALGLPILPLFWVASEDHDWAEVNHAVILDIENELRHVSVEAAEDAQLPIHARVLGPELEAVVDEFMQFLPNTEFSNRYLELLREGCRGGRSLAEAFHAVFGELMAPFDLLLVDAADPGVKEQGADVLRQEAKAGEAHEALLREQTDRLQAAGYHAQVPVLEGGLNVFFEGPMGRERVFREKGNYRLRRSGEVIAAGEFQRLLSQRISRFSPNVLLRPVVESAVFPVVAYVAGPAELSYYAQIGCLFDAHAIGMPLIFPRFSAVLVEAKNRKVLDKFGLDGGELGQPLHEVASEIARKDMPAEVAGALSALRRGIAEGAARLVDAVAKIDPTLKGPVLHARNESFAGLDEAEKKIVQGVKRQDEIAIAQLAKAQRHLFPDGKPQERVLNVFYYLTRYGPALLPAIAERFEIELGREAPEWRGVECPPAAEATSERVRG